MIHICKKTILLLAIRQAYAGKQRTYQNKNAGQQRTYQNKNAGKQRTYQNKNAGQQRTYQNKNLSQLINMTDNSRSYFMTTIQQRQKEKTTDYDKKIFDQIQKAKSNKERQAALQLFFELDHSKLTQKQIDKADPSAPQTEKIKKCIETYFDNPTEFINQLQYMKENAWPETLQDRLKLIEKEPKTDNLRKNRSSTTPNTDNKIKTSTNSTTPNTDNKIKTSTKIIIFILFCAVVAALYWAYTNYLHPENPDHDNLQECTI